MKHILMRLCSSLLVFALIAAVALTMTSCDSAQDPITPTGTTASAEAASQAFTLEVTFADGRVKSETYELEGEVNLGDYLLEKGVIAGDDGQYGLYVKTVMGETHDYDTDGSYWSLYVDGEPASTGVDGITAEDGATYAFKAESGS